MKNPNIRLFYGPNQFTCMREVLRWKRSFVDKYGDFDLEVLDGKKCTISDIISCCDTQPFMSEKRLIIVRDFIPEASKSTDDTEKKGASKVGDPDTLISYFDSFPDSCVLVFVSANPDKRVKLFKALSKVATVSEFPEMKGVSFLQWLQQEIAALGCRMERDALEYFRLQTGEDMWKAHTELQKLSLYTREPITTSDIDLVVSSNAQVKIFAFVDCLGQRDIARATKHFHNLLDRGESIYMVYNMIIRQFRLLLQVRFLLDRKTDQKTIMSRLRLAPFQVQSLLAQARNFTEEQLRAIYDDLLEIDIALKTGKISVTTEHQELFMLSLEKFFVKHSFFA